ncbi:cobalamin B12-binding domain-containing protein [Cereibacter changlensis]|uniref:Cobalamin B12-binding domain-containing protein n=1 Tax=Cereibacter changlensis TaxID=402884 RepID=A0A4U0YSS6_9RHOB|nr:cobalamin-dependent protein [Cereibacter changlensis]TKA95702.1 cobalamin B12-binding domain-containing protein [Cereibacter changlensis]
MLACHQTDPVFVPATRFQRQVDVLCDAALAGQPEACKRASERLKKLGVPSEQIIDLHIPAAARQIGEQWVRDEISFADVTISVSRLQALLRHLERPGYCVPVGDPHGLSILLLVASENDHTLGAMVVVNQLRRRGCSVRLILAARPETVIAETEITRFDVVMISAAQGDSARPLRRLIQAVRKSSSSSASIIIGGGMIDSESDILRLTGADFAEKDTQRALALCRLRSQATAGKRKTM